ncbi:MAG TPA: chromosomal replication initiator protein DnaA [Bacilli bacterium]|nr:chromosomal replication initiator protein DnaA [Bacilli bacterium]
MIKSISEITQLWDRSLARIKEKITERHVYDAFFTNTYIYTINGDTISVVANSNLAKSVLASTYTNLVEEIVADITESNYRIDFIVAEEISKTVEKPVEKARSSFFQTSKINPKFTFDNFVVGRNSNLQAYQAALMISATPGKMYNPLFIYASSGLGKTHLLHAIGNYIKETTPLLNVLYISTDDFVEEYIRFVHGDKESESLKDFFRSIDVLLIDDIQFLAEKPKTEEMFFHIFNSLVNSNKQIVLTSDRHPSELKGLENRLVSRFNQGLQISISVPDLETRKEILKKKIIANNLDVNDFDDDVLEFFADRFGNNVRDLEGALNRLLFFIINIHPTTKVTYEIAAQSVESLINVLDSQTKLSEKRVISVVADYYNLTPTQLTGRNRTTQVSMARHIAMYLMRELLDLPFSKVGKAFGGKDHSTVMNAIQKVEKLLKTDPSFKKVIDDLNARLK